MTPAITADFTCFSSDPPFNFGTAEDSRRPGRYAMSLGKEYVNLLRLPDNKIYIKIT
jgi:hypothetical protein